MPVGERGQRVSEYFECETRTGYRKEYIQKDKEAVIWLSVICTNKARAGGGACVSSQKSGRVGPHGSHLVKKALGVDSLNGVPHLHKRHASARNKLDLGPKIDQQRKQRGRTAKIGG